jgi:transcriptional regulator GlxA family with amidase domain
LDRCLGNAQLLGLTPPGIRHIGFLLLPEFAMMAFTSAIEPLRCANRLAPAPLYRWTLHSADGAPVTAANGVTVLADDGIGHDDRPDMVLVCGGVGAHRYDDPRVMRWLRQQASRSIDMGSLSTGSFILARAGLLKGHRCTIHWESLPALQEAFPEIEATNRIYEIDRGRLTCSGGTAALDMMLRLIAEDTDPELAAEICRNFHHDRVRTAEDRQHHAERLRLGRHSAKLAEAVELMARNIEFPLTPKNVADTVGVSLRQLERLYRQHLSATPHGHYLELRLCHARRLLLETSMSVLDVSLASGFSTQSHFTRCYRQCFGRTPTAERGLN